ncbi:hypothetical protein Syun_006980 [Stephania yunnanensis]|uniref:Uncharacterized protein n=1 Tax=Stephania yunnanensis TaxID=152371 RepID=A0AAP0KZD1_9MAGN
MVDLFSSLSNTFDRPHLTRSLMDSSSFSLGSLFVFNFIIYVSIQGEASVVINIIYKIHV